MNKKLLANAIGLGILIGITCFALATLLVSESATTSGSYEEAAPAAENRAPSNDEESARFNQVAMVLTQSAVGRHLLRIKETYQVDVQFEETSGSRFRKQENLIILDSNHNSVKAALFFAHEMQHAQAFHEGEQADPKSETRQAFVEHKLREEAKGVAVSLQMKMELEQLGSQVTKVTFPMEDRYREAYQLATEQASLIGTNLSKPELDAIGQAAGEQALFDAFIGGEIQTSNTYDSYPDYYGRVWDEVHPIQALISDSRFFNDLRNIAFDFYTLFTFLNGRIVAN